MIDPGGSGVRKREKSGRVSMVFCLGSLGVGWLDDVIVIFWKGNRRGRYGRKKMSSKCLV